MLKRVLSGISMLMLMATVVGVSACAASNDSGKVDYSKITPVQLAKQTPKGQLHNPYDWKDKKVTEEGHAQFMSHGCNGCHGGGGGGGMCPPLINGVWVYGGDDDTLFRLVSLGSVKLQKHGYARRGMENVVGPMPQMGLLIKNSKELWEILAWVRSAYDGPKGYREGGPSLAPPPGGN